MKIEFDDHNEWLDELEFVHSQEQIPMVRLALRKVDERDSQGKDYQLYVVCASFFYEDLMYELICDCDYQYLPPIEMGDGQETSERVLQDIRQECERLGVPVRKGRVDLEI